MTLLDKFIDQYCFVQGNKEEQEACKEVFDDVMLVVSKRALKILLDKQKKETKETIDNWVNSYDNYLTMMGKKKNYERGLLARELRDEILKKLNK